MSTNVLIAGGGPAAIEAALALHRLAGEKIVTTLLAPESDLTYRPLSVLSPFAAGDATRYPLERMATDIGFTHVRGRLASVDVRWTSFDAAGAERTNEHSHYILWLGDDGQLRIRVALTRPT